MIQRGQLTMGEVDVLMRALRYREVTGQWPALRSLRAWWGGHTASLEADRLIERGLLEVVQERRGPGRWLSKVAVVKLGPGGHGG